MERMEVIGGETVYRDASAWYCRSSLESGTAKPAFHEGLNRVLPCERLASYPKMSPDGSTPGSCWLLHGQGNPESSTLRGFGTWRAPKRPLTMYPAMLAAASGSGWRRIGQTHKTCCQGCRQTLILSF